jgi:hypothetical protein
MDPYDMRIYPRALTDARLFRENNRIGHYRYWTMERFFALWARTPHDGVLRATCRQYWIPRHWPDQQREALEALGRPYTKGPLFNPNRLLTAWQWHLVEMVSQGDGIPAWV